VFDPEPLRAHLCALGDAIRGSVIDHRDEHGTAGLGEVVGRVTADVTYAVDRIGEDRVLSWLDVHWPAEHPVRLVMEGIEDDHVVVAPASAGEPRWVLIVDPIDGTRSLMVDKRPAWALTALAPIGAGGGARLADVAVAAMTEIPTTRQWRADQVSAVRGRGPAGVAAQAIDVRPGAGVHARALSPTPSTATSVEHGFATFCHALPDGKALLAAVEERVWDELMPPGPATRQVFEDQYLCSGGQLYDVLSGRDRLVADLRPLALARLGRPLDLTAHPYDVCTALVLTEAGGVFEDPRGGPVDVPLDTTTPVAWVAYANPMLAARVRPVIARVVAELLSG
jgi:fructose-1,6-bisphosphatase/inositol monophosphatase family enzyme